MESLRIENLRSLKDTGEVPLKAINLLLGANSSGKSTFLRVFPLLKQSIEVRTRGPILWYGDYVDFGDYKSAVRAGEKEIVYHFDILAVGRKKNVSYYHRTPNFIEDTNIHIKIHIKELNYTTYVHELNISFDDQLIEINLTAKGKVESLLVNKSDYTAHCDNIIAFDAIGLLPRLRERSKTDDMLLSSRFQHGILFFTQLFELFKDKNRRNTTDNTLKRLIQKFGIGSKQKVLSSIIENTINLKHWSKQISNWDISNKDFKKFNDLLIASRAASILEYLDDSINGSVLNFSYIAPLRATAQRYYRRQDLAVTEVDFQGQNLAMFIDNMTDRTKLNFQNWVSKHFGFYPDTKSSEGHISLRIIDSSTKEDYNIADRGFGYSQILPVITLLWSVVTNNSNSRRTRSRIKTKILAIEQPELHLHPSLQAQMTKAFIAAIELAKEKEINLKLIIETHSQTLVNTLGHEIAEDRFSSSDASIVLFEKNLTENCSNVKLAYYNKEGYLENWPIGFFEPQN